MLRRQEREVAEGVYYPTSLERQIGLLPTKQEWSFGPLRFALRSVKERFAITWDCETGTNPVGTFHDNEGNKWGYTNSRYPEGRFLNGQMIRSLQLYRIKGGSIDPGSFVQYGYRVDRGQFVFSAIIPDVFGDIVYYSGGISELSRNIPVLWVDRLASNLPQSRDPRARSDNPPIVIRPEYQYRHGNFTLCRSDCSGLPPTLQRHISISSIERWLTASHLVNSASALEDPDVLGMFRLNNLSLFKDGVLCREYWNLATQHESIKKIANRIRPVDLIGRSVFPMDTNDILSGGISEVQTLTETDGRHIFDEINIKKAVALVILVHGGKNWYDTRGFTPDMRVLVGERIDGKPMAGQLSVISGKLEGLRGEGHIRGAVAAAAREVAEELVIRHRGKRIGLNNRGVSISPVLVPGGYIDQGTGRSFLVTSAVVIIADPNRQISFEWSKKGRLEYNPSKLPFLIPIDLLADEALLSQFYPGAKEAVYQSLNLASVVGVEFINLTLLNREDELGEREYYELRERAEGGL